MFPTRPISRALMLALTALLLAALSGCTIWREQKPPTWKSATGAEAYERLMWQEIKAKNWPQVEQNLAGAFVLVTPRGTRDRQGALQWLRTLNVREYSLGDLQSTPNGADVIVTYTLAATGTVGDNAIPAQPVRVMTVWQEAQGGRWLAIAVAITPAA